MLDIEHKMMPDDYEMEMFGYTLGKQLVRERQLDKIWESLSLEEKEEIIMNNLCCC